MSIARAILKNSPILLLDEATASLDIENELAVKRAILGLLSERKTVVMIAHTLSIVRNADQILVVADGNIAESGTHEELLARGGKYAAMWAAGAKTVQLSGDSFPGTDNDPFSSYPSKEIKRTAKCYPVDSIARMYMAADREAAADRISLSTTAFC
ncbi:MAG: hypothetical protein ACLVD8_26040 [Enterocloster sp.]|uniref:hypothetical protein n=1 Tax=Enterocloster sp. TaxID=2719315 RepID=UPI0039997E96